MDYIEIPEYVTMHPELTMIDKEIYITLLWAQKKTDMPLTNWSQFEDMVDKVNKGKNKAKRIKMKDLLASLEKMSKLHLFSKYTQSTIYHKLEPFG